MTDKERRFWEKCGFKPKPYQIRAFKDGEVITLIDGWVWPDGTQRTWLPGINSLDNLMKYAVPKLRDLSEDNTLKDIEFHWEGLNISDVVEVNVVLDFQEFTGRNKSPAKALYEALCQALEVEG